MKFLYSLSLALPLVIACCSSPVQAQTGTPKAVSAPSQLVHRFQMSGHVNALAFSADGRYIAAAGDFDDRSQYWERQIAISVWAVGSGKLISSFQTRGDITALAFADREGKELLTIAGYAEGFAEVVRWNTQNGQEQKKFVRDDAETYYMALSPDSSQLAVGLYGSTLLLNAKTLQVERELKPIENSEGAPMHYSSDGLLLIMDLQTKINIYDAHSGTLIRFLPIKKSDYVTEAWFHDGNNQYLLTQGEHFEFRDANTLRRVTTLGAVPMGTVVVSPSQKFVFSGDCNSPGDDPQNPYAVRVWDLETGTLLLTLKGHTNNIRAGAFSRDERLLASGDSTGRINVWSLSSLYS